MTGRQPAEGGVRSRPRSAQRAGRTDRPAPPSGPGSRRDPAPRPLAECERLRAECDEMYDRYCLALSSGRGSRARVESAQLDYIAAHKRWVNAFYGGDGTPWDRKRS